MRAQVRLIEFLSQIVLLTVPHHDLARKGRTYCCLSWHAQLCLARGTSLDASSLLLKVVSVFGFSVDLVHFLDSRPLFILLCTPPPLASTLFVGFSLWGAPTCDFH